MNRSTYFNYIEDKLSTLCYRVRIRGKINLLDLNIYSETFFAQFLNFLFGYKLNNMNCIKQNIEGIDLIDTENKIIAQVSSTYTKQKVDKSLSKDIFKHYPDFHFKFIAITEDVKNLKYKSFNNPHQVIFTPEEDIYDIKTLLNFILNMEVKEQYKLYEFIKSELGSPIDTVKVDTNLASIIGILSEENLSDVTDFPEINSFEILRKIEFNDLLTVQWIIDDYKIYYKKLHEKYQEFDEQGTNKSLSVLNIIRRQYIKLAGKIEDPQELFFGIMRNIIDIIHNSNNYIEIPYEELEMCVSILVVDAFIRCKIFKNPEGYNYVTT